MYREGIYVQELDDLSESYDVRNDQPRWNQQNCRTKDQVWGLEVSIKDSILGLQQDTNVPIGRGEIVGGVYR